MPTLRPGRALVLLALPLSGCFTIFGGLAGSSAPVPRTVTIEDALRLPPTNRVRITIRSGNVYETTPTQLEQHGDSLWIGTSVRFALHDMTALQTIRTTPPRGMLVLLGFAFGAAMDYFIFGGTIRELNTPRNAD